MPHVFHVDPIVWVLLAAFVAMAVCCLFSRRGRMILAGVGIAFVVALLMGCGPKDTKVVVDTRPPVTIVEVRYVPIPAELVKPTPIAEGRVDQVLDVARERKAQLEQCNADKAKIGGIAGTKVPC